MKDARNLLNFFIIILSLFILSLTNSCDNNSQWNLIQQNLISGSNSVIIDPSLQTPVGTENAELANLLNRNTGVIEVPGIGRVVVLLDFLVIDPIDSPGEAAFLEKYGFPLITDPEIPLHSSWQIGPDEILELPTTEKILALDLEKAIDGYLLQLIKERLAPTPIKVSSEDTLKFLELLARMLLQDTQKVRIRIIAIHWEKYPDPAEETAKANGLSTLMKEDWENCFCIDDTMPRMPVICDINTTCDAGVYNPFTGPFPYNQCSRSVLHFGRNVLIVDGTTVYDNNESFVTGPEGNFHLWAYPISKNPLYLSWNFDHEVPEGANDTYLWGATAKGDQCEWYNGPTWLAYQGYVIWPWEKSDPPNLVSLFIWEGDECWDFYIFEVCNPDDAVAFFNFTRQDTLGGYLARDQDGWDIDLEVRTIDFCRGPDPATDNFYQESCNDYDDDCDGYIDEDFIDKWQPCNIGVGQCLSTGLTVCEFNEGDPSFSTACNAPDFQPLGFEICDGRDNDCDGQTDENWLQEGWGCGLNLGECQSGSIICSNGSLTCFGQTPPTSEVCDSKDNDCDGVVDEGCACTAGSTRTCSVNVGNCQTGTQNCQGGTWSPTCEGGITPVDEVCDYQDNNCNGVIDEGVLNACGDCGPVPTEICDGIDNDCDGQTDEGLRVAPCMLCANEIGPETCDGIDNDCDGSTDERDSPLSCGVGFCQRFSYSICDPCTPGDPYPETLRALSDVPVGSDRTQSPRCDPGGPGGEGGAAEDWCASESDCGFINDQISWTCTDGQDNDCDGATDGDDCRCWGIQGGGG